MHNDEIAVFLHREAGITDPHIAEAIASAATARALSKGELILREGQLQNDVSLLVDGAVRTAMLDVAGRDNTDCLITKKGMVIAPCADFTKPSPVHVEALLPSHIISIPLETIGGLFASNLSFALDYIGILQSAWQMHWDIKTVVCQKAARDRYLWFLEAYPGVIDLIPHHYIASYLGMTQVTLSRVRREVHGG